MSYDVDDPNKVKVDWTTVDNWFVDANVCSTPLAWYNQKKAALIADLQDKKDNGLTTKNDSNLEVLKELIRDKHLHWASWFIIRVMDKQEYEAYIDFALAQLDQITVVDNDGVENEIESAQSCAKYAKDNDKPSAAGKTIEYVEHAYALAYPDGNTDDVLLKILNYGVQIIENRT